MVTRDEIILCLDKAIAIDEASGLSLDEIKITVTEADLTETEALTDNYFLVKKSSGKNPVFWLAKTGLKRAELLKEQLEAEYKDSVMSQGDQSDKVALLESQVKELKKSVKQYRDSYEQLQGTVARVKSELKMCVPEGSDDLAQLAYDVRVKALTKDPLAEQIKFEFEHYGFKPEKDLPVADQVSRFLSGFNQLKAEFKGRMDSVNSSSYLLGEVAPELDHFNAPTEKNGVKLAMVDRLATVLRDYKEWRDKSTEINLMAVRAHTHLDKADIAIGLPLDERVAVLLEDLAHNTGEHQAPSNAFEPVFQSTHYIATNNDLNAVDYVSIPSPDQKPLSLEGIKTSAKDMALTGDIDTMIFECRLIGTVKIKRVAELELVA
jgi:hypothetical protein